jgi:hypothetical protein
MSIQIDKPIWNGGRYCVGIASYRVALGDNDIEIMYQWKKGERAGKRKFPDVYTITGKQIATYPIQVWKGVRLHIIPVNDLTIKEAV